MRWQAIATLALLTAWGSLGAISAQADTTDGGKAKAGYGSTQYVWGRMSKEEAEVLRLDRNAARGADTFKQCKGCHRAEGVGRPDGTYPRLTGQHADVIIKQIVDTRAGLRVNPKMEPFSSEHALNPQEIADVAEYLSQARTTVLNGQGDAAAAARGQSLYTSKACADCHGSKGEGNANKFYPAVAQQHYGYLLRELQHVQTGTRGNSHPDMVKSIKGLPEADLQALASFMSRLPDPRGTVR